MSLPENVYQALKDIVGARNISDDPALLDSYRYSLAHTAIHLGPYYDTFTPAPRRSRPLSGSATGTRSSSKPRAPSGRRRDTPRKGIPFS